MCILVLVEDFDLDIGNFYFITEEMSDNERYDASQKVWKSEAQFSFPSQPSFGNRHKYQASWLSNLSWLAYSKKLDGACYLPCVLFGRCIGVNASKLSRRMKSFFSEWSCASRVLEIMNPNQMCTKLLFFQRKRFVL